jgi:hypothetical protein
VRTRKYKLITHTQGGLWAAAYNLLLLPTTVVKNIMTFNREQAKRAILTTTPGSASSRRDVKVLPLQGGAGSGPEGTETSDEDVEASSPYDLAKRQLKEARTKLATQTREANKTLVQVHQHYERKLELMENASDRPSAPDA